MIASAGLFEETFALSNALSLSRFQKFMMFFQGIYWMATIDFSKENIVYDVRSPVSSAVPL